MTGMEALMVGSTVLGAATSAAAASAQNRAIKRSAAAQRESERVTTRQLRDQAGQATDSNRRVADQVAARTRVLSIASGGGGGDTRDDLLRTIEMDSGRNADTIQQNLDNRVASVRSGTAANLAALSGQMRSVGLDIIGGGIDGFNTGLGLYRGGKELFGGDS